LELFDNLIKDLSVFQESFSKSVALKSLTLIILKNKIVTGIDELFIGL
jgi:hypothetical protein